MNDSKLKIADLVKMYMMDDVDAMKYLTNATYGISKIDYDNIETKRIKKIIFAGDKTIILFNLNVFGKHDDKVIVTKHKGENAFLCSEDLIMYAIIKRYMNGKKWHLISMIPIPETIEDQRHFVNGLANEFIGKSITREYRKEITHIYDQLSKKDRDKIICVQKPKKENNK